MIEGLVSALKETVKEVSLYKDFIPNFIENLKESSQSFEDADKPLKSNGETEKKDNTEKIPLTDEQKEKIKEESGYSDEVIDNISCWEEYEVYRDAGLKEVEIGGKKCLIRDDIDLDQKDDFGQTNRERMENGHAPITKSGETVELHHIGQKSDSPLAELTTQEHRGKGNDTILHDKSKESEIDRNEFGKERSEHWKSRVNEN
ncbi:hypothetical protein FDF86_01575 [Clostridium botulinum]|nr:hypothetical protein [Clostridium botulinum]